MDEFSREALEVELQSPEQGFITLLSVPRREPIYRPRHLEGRGGWVPLRKNLATLPKYHTVRLSLSLPPKDQQPFTRMILHGRMGNNQTFQGLADTGPELN